MSKPRQTYPSDLSEKQWRNIAPLLPKSKANTITGGRPPGDLREILNGIMYVLRSGSEWRMMPHDLPPWQTVYGYFNRWSGDGTWERVNAELTQKARTKAGKKKVLRRLLSIVNRSKQPR